MTATTATTEVPVLIVGAGPAGLVTAATLARHGVSSLLVERHPGTSIHPRATGVSTRSMEILRRLGLEDEVRSFSAAARPTMSIGSALGASDGMEVPLGFPTDELAASVSPTRPAISPQDHVEPVLVRHLERRGLTELRFDTELVALDQGGDAAVATIVDRRTGVQSRVRAQYVVGADGGRSTVRSLLGIDAVGPTDLEQHLAILFRADLSPRLGESRHALYGIGAGPGGAILVTLGPDDRWLLATPMPRQASEAVAADPAATLDLLRRALGDPDLDAELLAAMPLTFVAQVATRWREGRVFLAGDAAHRMPPFGGRGMNTAIADADNLGWKLAWVVRGLADPALLDSYEAERGPVGRANVSLALERYRDAQRESGLVLDLAPGTGETSTPDGLFEDLGYTYRSDVIVPDGDGPVALAGTRAPHAWLDGDGAGHGLRSTLDAFGDGLTLLALDEERHWRCAAERMSFLQSLTAAVGSLVPGAIHRPTVRVVVHAVDPASPAASEIGRAYGLERGGAVLVRPDGHVAAHWTRSPRNRRVALTAAVSVALGARRSTPPPSAARLGEPAPSQAQVTSPAAAAGPVGSGLVSRA